jgi:hypothetical protein
MGRFDSKFYSTFTFHLSSAPCVVFKHQAIEGDKMVLGLNRPATNVELE